MSTPYSMQVEPIMSQPSEIAAPALPGNVIDFQEALGTRLLVTGSKLIAAGYRPGPGFREMLDAAEDAQLEGTITTTEEGLALVREMFPLPSPEP